MGEKLFIVELKEVYAVGDSRDVNESINKFLGRSRSIEPFLKEIGAQPAQ